MSVFVAAARVGAIVTPYVAQVREREREREDMNSSNSYIVPHRTGFKRRFAITTNNVIIGWSFGTKLTLAHT